MTAFTIDELVIPDRLDSADAAGGGAAAADFLAMVTVRNTVESGIYGGDDLVYSAEELLPMWQDPYEHKRTLVARVAGRIVARGIYQYSTEASRDAAWLTIEVLPEFRRRGIGSALLTELAGIAAAEGRGTLQTYALSENLPGERLTPPTGFGSVALADDGVRFLVRHGFALEQVERASRLSLPVDQPIFTELWEGALAAAGPDYRIHTFVDRTPPEWLEDMAMLQTRMSTDAPSAGLDEAEDVWTVDRLLDYESRHEGSPRTELVAMVEHLPSGRLAGFTSVTVPAELHRAIAQEDTIVLHEHRGHRLGMLLKLANIEHIERVAPGHPSITTFNAEENRHVLSVNEAVGFEPIGYEGAWRKDT